MSLDELYNLKSNIVILPKEALKEIFKIVNANKSINDESSPKKFE